MRKLPVLIFILCTTAVSNAQTELQRIPLPPGQSSDSVHMLEQMIREGRMMSTKDTGIALKLLRKAAAGANRMKQDFLEAKAYSHIGDIYFQQNLYNRALPNFSRAADIFYETEAQPEIAYAILGLAKSQYYRGNYTRATASFTEAIQKSEQFGLAEITAEANEYLGLIYGAFQNFQRNADLYLRSLAIKQKLHDDKGIVRVAGNLSEIYFQLRKYDSALKFADMAFVSAQKLNLSTDMYMAKIKRTTSLIRLNKIVEAEEELIFFEKIMNQRQDANLLIRYQALLGSYCMAKAEEKKSLFHYDSALSIIKKNAFPELLIIVYNDMAAAYYQAGNLQKAYDAYKKYNTELALFYTGDNIRKLAILEGLVGLESSKDEIMHLNNENKLKAALILHEQNLGRRLAWENFLKDSILQKEKMLSEALSRENSYRETKLDDEKKLSASVTREFGLQQEKLANERRLRFTLVAGLGLVMALGTVIFIMYRKQRKKNKIILQQSDDLQTLIKEIHHRVKNNLQIISSLLDLQALSIKNKQAAGAVREGKMRVQSMALIHQNLYNEGNIKGILMEDYIKTLVENLFNSYNIQRDKIKLVTDIDHLNLDVDTVIPLGLIINELLSNSLKHAFKESAAGEISVTLKENNRHLLLLIKDNGCGFPPKWSRTQNNSFGFNLIDAFAQKLKAVTTVYNDDGACIAINIARYKIA